MPESTTVTEQKPSINPESGNLKIWAWNVNGLRATLKSNSFKTFVDEAKPAILCLNETKIDAETLAKDKLPE